MIKSLRRKFIAMSMSLVSIFILIVIGTLLIIVYDNQKQSTEKTLQWALKQSSFSQPISIEGKDEVTDPGINSDRPSNMSVFCINVDSSGNISEVTADNGIVISDEVLSYITNAALEDKDGSGVIKEYSLRFLRQDSTSGGSTVAFADISTSRTAFFSILKISSIGAAVSLLFIYLISAILADKAVAPVAVSWKKQKQFVADASHELKTPLTVILANTDIVLANGSQTVDSERKWLENTKEEAKRMNRLVNDMLFLAKSDAGTEKKLTFGDVNLSDIVSSCALSFESLAFEKKVNLETDIVPNVFVGGDATKLKEMTVVLCDNAVKYSSPDTTVYVSLLTTSNTVKLTVKNTGSVIAEEKQKDIFERFFRADESRARDTGGYGLGLSIAKNIALQHKGSIKLDYSNEKQTSFTVTLPLSTNKHTAKE